MNTAIPAFAMRQMLDEMEADFKRRLPGWFAEGNRLRTTLGKDLLTLEQCERICRMLSGDPTDYLAHSNVEEDGHILLQWRP